MFFNIALYTRTVEPPKNKIEFVQTLTPTQKSFVFAVLSAAIDLCHEEVG